MSMNLLEEVMTLYPYATEYHTAIKYRDAAAIRECLYKYNPTYIQSGVTAISAHTVMVLIEQGKVEELQEKVKRLLRAADLYRKLRDLYGYGR